MAHYSFKRKVVVITGAAGGIGRALSSRFAAAGAHLLLLDILKPQLDALAQQFNHLGGQVMALPCDVTDEQAVQAAMQKANHHFGGIDVLINNAGITHRSTFADTEVAVFRRIMDVNFFGALNCTRAALPSIRERQGMIITLSSLAGVSPQLWRSGYSASKHALHGLFESLRVELEEEGVPVHVMMVCPGFTATDINKNALQGDGTPARDRGVLVGRVASPATVADCIYRGALKRKRLLVLSNVNRLARVLARLFPKRFERMMSQRFRIHPAPSPTDDPQLPKPAPEQSADRAQVAD